MSEQASRWSHTALNLALLALGVVVMALLYALVSQTAGPAASPPTVSPTATERRAAVSTEPAPDAAAPRDEIIQVGVRNGCGETGLAAETRGHLVRAGFDVVEVGNYSDFDVDSSMVIDRVGNRAAARRVAHAMGIPERRVRREIGSQYHLDVTVVLGGDYATLRPFRDTQATR
jgi:hypothetical protein